MAVLRKSLDCMYTGSGYLAALFLLGIGLATLVQITSRVFHIAFDGVEISSYFMAASTFLGLAYTFRCRAHVRVELLTYKLGRNARRVQDILCCLVGACAMIYVSYEILLLTLSSYEYRDLSSGLIKIPLWIPQTSMLVGSFIFSVALVDQLVWLLLFGDTEEFKHYND